jgi:hypothetical protein
VELEIAGRVGTDYFVLRRPGSLAKRVRLFAMGINPASTINLRIGIDSIDNIFQETQTSISVEPLRILAVNSANETQPISVA